MAESYASFGRFLLLKQRTQDALGTLWRAGEMERNSFRRIVWLRRFDATGLERAALVAHVASANQVAQVLKATNVVRNGVAGNEGGVPFVAWDYVPAQPLDQLMARAVAEQFPIAIDNALLIVEKLAAALAAASAVEVTGEPLIHGFLVPHLVVVGNDGEAQVAGFGLGRGFRANLERAGVRKIAAPYLAPEVLAGGPSSRRSDVYSLGAILFQLLTGQPLPADPAARAAALERPAMAFEETLVPQDVLAILARTLSPRPEDRYPSAGDFKRELEKLLYGGAYSPTTFNLALFMDRLYRNEIEQEDRELQRERALDVATHYQPPKPEEPEAPPPAAPSRTGLFAAIGAAVVLVGVIGYLLLSRTSAPPALDAEAQKKMLQELVNTQVAQALKEKEGQLRKELEAERARTEELRTQLEKQKQSPPGARQVSPEEQQRLQRELAAREAEQKRKEDELAQVRRQQEAEAAKLKLQQAAAPTRPPAPQPASAAAPAATAPAAAPTAAPAVPTAAPVVAAAATPTAAPAAEPAAVTTGLGSSVQEGDLVDMAQLDAVPQSLVEGKVVLPRNAAITKTPLTGYVILRVLVNEKGGVDEVTVLRAFQPSRPGIDDACVEAVKQNRYRPAMKDGHKVKTWITVTRQLQLLPSR